MTLHMHIVKISKAPIWSELEKSSCSDGYNNVATLSH